MNRRVLALIGLLLCSTAYAAGTSIWNATDRGTVAATDRLPVATSSSSGPLYVTPLTLQSYLLSGSATTEVLANNAGAFDGDSGFTFNATNNTVDLGGATLTASDPVLDLSQTWNNAAVAFTGIKLNVTDTASAAASGLLDLQVGGTSYFAAGKNFDIFLRGASGIRLNAASASTLDVYGNGTTSMMRLSTSRAAFLAEIGLGASPGSPDVILSRDSAGILAQRNGTNPQVFRVYDTYTDASNSAGVMLSAWESGDWVQIRAFTNGTGADNYGIALTPTGTGAISAQVPDSTVAGGNARGANAVDWSTGMRSAATQVASGANSTISGGYGHTASGSESTVAGGRGATATGTRSTVGGGLFNDASGAGATVSGGQSNTATGVNSWIPGGLNASSRGLSGAGAYSSGMRSAVGDAQVILQPVRRTTTDATPVSLATNGTPAATTVMVLPASSTLMCDAMVVAQSGAGTDNAGYKVSAVIQRDGASNTALVGAATTTTVAEDTAGMNATIIANDTLESAEIQVTGVAATTIQWMGELKCVQVL